MGEKVSILFDRVIDLWEGPKDTKNSKKGNVKVSQPIAQNQNQNQNQIAMNQSLNSMGSTSISSLPPMQTQQLPDYNQMHQADSTPLIDADTPGMEPMAANSGGMSSFGGASGW